MNVIEPIENITDPTVAKARSMAPWLLIGLGALVIWALMKGVKSNG